MIVYLSAIVSLPGVHLPAARDRHLHGPAGRGLHVPVSLGLSALGLLLATLAPPRQRHIVMAVLFAMLVFVAFGADASMMYALLESGGMLFESSEFWEVNAAAADDLSESVRAGVPGGAHPVDHRLPEPLHGAARGAGRHAAFDARLDRLRADSARAAISSTATSS